MRTCRALLVALVGVFVGGLLAAPTPAYAACDGLSVRQQADQADAVFVGTVDGPGGPPATVRVTDVYKGAVDATVRVDGGDPANQDSVPLEDGSQYLFFAQGKRSQWSTDRCLGTAPVSEGALGDVEDLLGAPTSFRPAPGAQRPSKDAQTASPHASSATPAEPGTNADPAGDRPERSGRGYAGVAVLVAALAGSFVLRSRRRRRRERSRRPGAGGPGSEDVGSENVGGGT